MGCPRLSENLEYRLRDKATHSMSVYAHCWTTIKDTTHGTEVGPGRDQLSQLVQPKVDARTSGLVVLKVFQLGELAHGLEERFAYTVAGLV